MNRALFGGHQSSWTNAWLVFIDDNSWKYLQQGKKNSLCKGQCTNHGIPMAVSATGQGEGGGLLERPIIEKTTPGRESEFDFRYRQNFAAAHFQIVLTCN